MLMQRPFAAALSTALVMTLPASSFAERGSPNSITARVVAGPNEASLGLG
jgi:hypothetical protein